MLTPLPELNSWQVEVDETKVLQHATGSDICTAGDKMLGQASCFACSADRALRLAGVCIKMQALTRQHS